MSGVFVSLIKLIKEKRRLWKWFLIIISLFELICRLCHLDFISTLMIWNIGFESSDSEEITSLAAFSEEKSSYPSYNEIP